MHGRREKTLQGACENGVASMWCRRLASALPVVANPAITKMSPIVAQRSMQLVPTFRSSCYIAAPTFTNFAKSWALAKILILVPLFYLKFLYRIRGSRCRNFK